MIPISTFNVLIATAGLFLLYAVIDLTNRVYGNIVMMFLSAFTFWYLGTAVNIGIVGDASISYTSPSLQMLLWFVGLIAFVYALILSIEIWFEKQREKELMKQAGD